MDSEVAEQHRDAVLTVLARVQQLFGGPVGMPQNFVAPADLESNLGLGRIRRV